MAKNIIVPYQRPRQNDDTDTGEERERNAKGCAKKQKNWNIDTDLDLLLLGKTGNGKSATGNSILQHQAFESSANMDSLTDEVDFDYTEVNGRVIKVVDVRGVEDTRMPTAQSRALFIRQMEYAIVANTKGYHAFLIVLRYSNRLTQEEVNTIKILKGVFGETFVRDYCIIVMTGGDLFYNDPQSNGLSFTTWCQSQTNIFFQELLRECSHRIVLFNNWSNDEAEKKKQILELLVLVDQLKGTRYTDNNFNQANLDQTKLIMQTQVHDLRENAIKETSLILQKLQFCQESFSDEQEELENLLARTDAFMEDLSGLDKKTKLLQTSIDNIREIKSNILLEIKLHFDIREWRKSFADDHKNMEHEACLEKEQLTNQYLKSTERCSDDYKLFLKHDEKLKRKKKSKKEEFFAKIKKRRDKLKLETQKQRDKYTEIKSYYIQSFLSELYSKLADLFQAIFSNIFKLLSKK